MLARITLFLALFNPRVGLTAELLREAGFEYAQAKEALAIGVRPEPKGVRAN